MAFTGKATYDAGSDLPELVEDVSDIIGIVSPHETPLLDHLGDPKRSATSTIHEWLEDSLLPNTDAIDEPLIDGENATTFGVANAGRFRVGDQIRAEGASELMLVTAVGASDITVIRSYGGSPRATLVNNQVLIILGNAALEGADRPAARFTNRVRQRNWTQIFTSSVEVSGTMQAARAYGVADEVDYQKQERLRELLRDLENTVINGVSPESNQQGNDSVRRTMNGIINTMETNLLAPGEGGVPPGDGANNDGLTEAVLNGALRVVWEQSSAQIDTIVLNGFQKRKVNAFASSSRRFMADDETYKDMVSVYESDYGVARVILSRWVPADAILLLDSTRIEVMPLVGRSFHYKPLTPGGDSEVGQLIGEYTLEMRNENAHAVLSGLSAV